MLNQHFLAFDIGAESGRAIVGTLSDSNRLELKEIHRFRTGQLSYNKHSYWNIYRFYEEIIDALHICVNKFQIIPQSIGVNTWDVDFGLIGKDGSLLRIPYTYRDTMTETSMPAFLERMGRSEVYQLTGIAMHKFNTLFQLYAMTMANDPVLQMADKLLFIPDIINYLLTGESKTEFTIATSSQLYNPILKEWDPDIFRKLGIPIELMQDLIEPGEVIGNLNDSISSAIDVEGIKVIAVASNDTASGLVATPTEDDNWAYINSGVWSLVGVERSEVIIDQRSMLYSFSNEGAAEGKYSFNKSIMGLWHLQQCKKSWEKSSGQLDYSELIRLGEMAEPFQALIDPDYAGFFNPLDMPAAINTFCRQTGQLPPQGIGPITRSILESLALKYRMVVEQLELLTEKKVDIIHVFGGGIQNELLCQFTANATGKIVIAGPEEASAIGNIIIQAISLGYIENVARARKIVMGSFGLKKYEPEDREVWDQAYRRYQNIAKQN